MELIKYSLVYTADSIRKFDSKSNRTADSIRDSIRTQKNDSQVPNGEIPLKPIPCTCFAQHGCNAAFKIHTRKRQIETKPVIKMQFYMAYESHCKVNHAWGLWIPLCYVK